MNINAIYFCYEIWKTFVDVNVQIWIMFFNHAWYFRGWWVPEKYLIFHHAWNSLVCVRTHIGGSLRCTMFSMILFFSFYRIISNRRTIEGNRCTLHFPRGVSDFLNLFSLNGVYWYLESMYILISCTF